jgi:D-alanine-D-alanine ligase
MRIGLTYDLQTDPADERQAEFDPPATLDALCEALAWLGHDVIRLGGAELLLAEPARLREADLVFNLAEGRAGRCREAWVPTLLELHRVPYVGSDALALALGLDKVMSKRLAQAHGIPTPRWVSIAGPSELPATPPFPFPAIVKPRWEGSGRGIDAGAVVETRQALAARAAWLAARCDGPILIEEFIPAGELTVLVTGNHPPLAHPAIQRPLDPASRLSCHVVTPAPARVESPLSLEPALDAEARRVAVEMFEAVTCRDLARVDLRVGKDGRVWFLEINPLPSFDPEGTLGLLAEHLGVTYAQLIGQILHTALRRLNLAVGAPSCPASEV